MKLLKLSVVAEMLGVSKRTIYRWCDKGILSPIKTPTNQYFFKEEDIINFINNSKINKK